MTKQFKDWHLYWGAYYVSKGYWESHKRLPAKLQNRIGVETSTDENGDLEVGMAVLRPISSITDEEIKEIMLLENDGKADFEILKRDKHDIEYEWWYKSTPKAKSPRQMQGFLDMCNTTEKTIKGLSLYLDLFNLISTNQALDSTDKKMFPVDPYKK